MATPNIQPLARDTYLAVIKNSIRTEMFRNFYVAVGGRKKDVMRNGELSCAFFVSSVLRIFGAAKRPHATVASTIKDLELSGWTRAKKPKTGDVLIWEKMALGGEMHEHVGFYIGYNKAVSNDYKTGSPAVHHCTFGTVMGRPKRTVTAIYRYPSFIV